MKKIFYLIAVLMLMAGCDDGDMGYRTFDFTGITPDACPDNENIESTSETYYKITSNEGLILVLTKGALINSPTKDPETGEDVPRKITLGTSNTLTYYDFVSTPTSLCTVAQIPAYNEKWIGQGTLSVSTFELIIEGKLKGYTHSITLENVSFKNGDETITIVDSFFGDITKKFGFTFDFTAEGADAPVVKQCETSNLLYTLQSPEILSISIADFDTIFQDVVGTQDISISDITEDSVLFNVYQSSATTSNVCGQGSEVPSQPIQRWQVIDGTLRIITSETGGIFSHDIYLKDAEFGSLTNADTFLLNKIIDVDDTNGYYFGKY